jgi:hypothetical protein
LPTPSKSLSAWFVFAFAGQLSHSSAQPSAVGVDVRARRERTEIDGQAFAGKSMLPKRSASVSVHRSHTSPMPSTSVSSWPGLNTPGQLSHAANAVAVRRIGAREDRQA